MSDLTPFRMSPVLAEKPWGGRRLEGYGKALPEGVQVGESWEVADLPAQAVTTVDNPRSTVAEGPHAGKALHQLIAEFGEDFLGCVSPTLDGDFPLLVKLLDAREHLSVQVHPDAAYVKAHSEARLKTESWYVIAADPDSHLYLGLRPGVTLEEVAARVGTPAIVGLLNVVAATPGDFHHLPAGLVHALGAGVLVAEVQTPSDTTFRLYDWEDRYDRPHRTLHAAAALETIRAEATSRYVGPPDRLGSRDLLKRELYWIREHRADGGTMPIDPKPEVRVLLVVAGSARIESTPMPAGSTFVLPAAIAPDTALAADPGAIVLEIGFV